MGGTKKREKSHKRKKSSTAAQNDKGLKQQRQGSNTKDYVTVSVTVSDILSQIDSVLYPSESDNSLPVFDSEVTPHTSNTMAEFSAENENFEKYVREQFNFLRISVSNVLEKQNIITKRLNENEVRMERIERMCKEQSKSLDFAHNENTDIKTKNTKINAQCESLQKSLNDANKIIEDLQRRQ
ncbi:hypothetical protein DPMN_110853 [Dreissena polymorpha]|uniref:Uncharacterized protein n=1 Tax=Dreissena polymorpha TaxID=45954 RepID=A0A9D4QNE9_DREPO|nr:hypothetical protein DPMN_110853 [Dreissena polymorpha]